MSNIKQNASDEAEFAKPLYTPIKRRSFFMYAGATAGATALLLSGCDDDDDVIATPGTVNLGTGDVGVLNFAYALEQLEAAFYARVVSSFASGFSADERTALTAIGQHEAIHRDFFKAAITAAAATAIIPGLTPNFDAINFSDRTAVLTAARTFEDLGVAAYNGAGRLIQNPTYLLLAGKIVSVEARHAAYIRDLLTPGSFASSSTAGGTVDANGLDQALTVAQVLTAAQPFIRETIVGTNVGQ